MFSFGQWLVGVAEKIGSRWSSPLWMLFVCNGRRALAPRGLFASAMAEVKTDRAALLTSSTLRNYTHNFGPADLGKAEPVEHILLPGCVFGVPCMQFEEFRMTLRQLKVRTRGKSRYCLLPGKTQVLLPLSMRDEMLAHTVRLSQVAAERARSFLDLVDKKG